MVKLTEEHYGKKKNSYAGLTIFSQISDNNIQSIDRGCYNEEEEEEEEAGFNR